MRSTAVSLGLFLSVFAAVALTGPGRIDVSDGLTRYDVSRSLIDHGDFAVRNPDVWYTVFPGRDGQRFSTYRFPQSILGVPALLLADLTGPVREQRRQFFFILISAFAAAMLAVAYLAWFRASKLTEGRALFWAAAGIFCTPTWFYATSTFDDVLGAAAIVAAIVVAGRGARARSLKEPVWSGLLLGLAFNCKQPLAVFGLAAAAIADTRGLPTTERALRLSVMALGLLLGIGLFVAYDYYKFPPAMRSALMDPPGVTPTWPGHPLMALAALALSPAAGMLWYSPALPLCIRGAHQWLAVNARFVVALGAGIIVFTLFIASLSFFKGDVAWGPRYLTAVFAVLWLFAPAGSARSSRAWVSVALVLGFCVQLAALSVVPTRLYAQRGGVPALYGPAAPALYFDPANGHLVQRPREIVEVWKARNERPAQFAPAIFKAADLTPSAIARYKLLNSFRPWWASQRYLAPEDRPVSTASALGVLCAILGAGGILMALGARGGTSCWKSMRLSEHLLQEAAMTLGEQQRRGKRPALWAD